MDSYINKLHRLRRNGFGLVFIGIDRSLIFFFFFILPEGENLLRDLEMLRDRAEYYARQSRQFNSLNGDGFGHNKRFDSLR